jgi:hypothetical protein
LENFPPLAPECRLISPEAPSSSLFEEDPEVNPDVDIAAKIGKDFFVDEKIPRHGQGYVRVMEHSVMGKELGTAMIFTDD